MRRLFALVIIIVLVGAALYYWKYSGPGQKDAQRALAFVGDKIESTKTTGEVKAALALDRELKACPIDVDSQPDGVVVLRGRVPRDELRATAERVAASVPVVRRVVNELSIDSNAAQLAWLRNRMASLHRMELPELNDGHRLPGREGLTTPAAVLIPIVNRPEGLTLLLTKRSDSLPDHPGQISFPGGRQEHA